MTLTRGAWMSQARRLNGLEARGMNFADRMMLQALGSEFRTASAAHEQEVRHHRVSALLGWPWVTGRSFEECEEEVRRIRASVTALAQAKSAAERALVDALDDLRAADPSLDHDAEFQAWTREMRPD